MFRSASHGGNGQVSNQSECEEQKAQGQEDVLDLGHLRHYTDHDRELERELLMLFRLQIRQYADKLADIEDVEEWRLATHSIKGAARSMGAARIAAVAEALEALGPCGMAPEGQTLIASLLYHLEACEAAIAGLEPHRR